MKLTTSGPLDGAETEALGARFGRVRTLEDVLRILATQRHAALAEVITQDEYTHDVVVYWPRGTLRSAAPEKLAEKPAAPVYLVFDTT